jgi:glucosyl-dolichyl phosphate glucuronosyltransferase
MIAVGGAPLPVYAKPRPRWYPAEFNWVFGCAYAGLPTTAAQIHHLIGTTMAVRKRDFPAFGGLRSDHQGDIELSHRLLALAPGSKLIYELRAVVHHYVPEARLSWSYFWRRCFLENREKVATMRDMGPAANLEAERRFVARALTRGVAKGLGQFVRGDLGGLLRAGTICIGLALAGAGYTVGTVESVLRRCVRIDSSSPPRY